MCNMSYIFQTTRINSCFDQLNILENVIFTSLQPSSYSTVTGSWWTLIGCKRDAAELLPWLLIHRGSLDEQ